MGGMKRRKAIEGKSKIDGVSGTKSLHSLFIAFL
jgi:hypothetical protein